MTPRQWIAVICMAGIVGSSSLRLFCVSACASQHARRATAHCHETPESGTTLTAATDCGQHDSFPALVEGRRVVAAAQLLALPVPAYAFVQPARVIVSPDTAFSDTSPPPLVRSLPLRI